MANYLYNGVELPDINTVWTDKETHPFAIIRTNGTDYFLYLGPSSELFYDGGVMFGYTYSSGMEQPAYILTDGEWVCYERTSHTHATRVDAYSVVGYSWKTIWANFTGVRGDTVFFTASDPVPVGGEPETPEPEAPETYLYNGAELPKLPEWDRDAYPYALITRREYASTICHYLYLSSAPIFYKTGTLLGNTTYTPITKEDGSALCYLLDILVSSGAYIDPNTGSMVDTWCRYENGDEVFTADSTTVFTYPRFWANYDVLNYESDEVILQASYPINAETGEEVRDYEIGGEPEPDATLTASDFYKVVNKQWVKHTAVKSTGSEWVEQPQKGYETQGGQWSALSQPTP